MSFKNKVKKAQFAYEERVDEFTGLIFHCQTCGEVYHLHIATVKVEKERK